MFIKPLGIQTNDSRKTDLPLLRELSSVKKADKAEQQEQEADNK